MDKTQTIDKAQTLERIRDLGLLAVIRGLSPESTLQIVEALIVGGVTGIEVTYSTPGAAGVVSALRARYGETILLGMGTLTEVAQVQEACEAGAHFLVSPITEPSLAHAMTASGLAVMMGALTPSEILHAYRLGSDVVKIFPGSLGGPEYMKALRGPFPDVPMMPTGGVDEGNLKAWFAAGAFAVGAGSNLTPKDLVNAGRFAEITEIARKFVEAVRAARG
jgi:2-dehydro-3-deoxyphosphogluconate aldolase/(4S)-4-hydroxy-2-oxoglutarate aldolase